MPDITLWTRSALSGIRWLVNWEIQRRGVSLLTGVGSWAYVSEVPLGEKRQAISLLSAYRIGYPSYEWRLVLNVRGYPCPT